MEFDSDADNLKLFSELLTLREYECLYCFASGKVKSRKEVAKVMQIREETVKSYIKSIKIKLKSKTIAHAVFVAIKHGINFDR